MSNDADAKTQTLSQAIAELQDNIEEFAGTTNLNLGNALYDAMKVIRTQQRMIEWAIEELRIRIPGNDDLMKNISEALKQLESEEMV